MHELKLSNQVVYSIKDEFHLQSVGFKYELSVGGFYYHPTT